jgi:hypothetical protein
MKPHVVLDKFNSRRKKNINQLLSGKKVLPKNVKWPSRKYFMPDETKTEYILLRKPATLFCMAGKEGFCTHDTREHVTYSYLIEVFNQLEAEGLLKKHRWQGNQRQNAYVLTPKRQQICDLIEDTRKILNKTEK